MSAQIVFYLFNFWVILSHWGYWINLCKEKLRKECSRQSCMLTMSNKHLQLPALNYICNINHEEHWFGLSLERLKSLSKCRGFATINLQIMPVIDWCLIQGVCSHIIPAVPRINSESWRWMNEWTYSLLKKNCQSWPLERSKDLSMLILAV